MSGQDEQPLKILVIGESAVGKSCLLLRYTDNKFQETFMTTIGVDFKTKYIDIDGNHVKLQIWDTAGQEKFRSITKAYYRGAHGILVVFDVSSRDSFSKVRIWVQSIKDTMTTPYDVILVGNKSDLPEHFVTTEEAEELAQELGMKYIETSAKTGSNVDAAFYELATMVKRRKDANNTPHVEKMNVKLDLTKTNKKKKKECC